MSLIEVVLVMSLIAVLMALSLPMLSHANAEARSVVCRQNLAEIGNAVTGYVRDYGRLPELAELPPHQPGLSLPEMVKPRLQTPNVVFCPSDETERSQVLGTSYHWATAYNGFEISALDRAVDQALVTDRESFHQGTDLAVNQLVLEKNKGKYRFIVMGSDEDEPADYTQDPTTGTPPPGSGDGDESDDDIEQAIGQPGRSTGNGKGKSNNGVRDHGQGVGRQTNRRRR